MSAPRPRAVSAAARAPCSKRHGHPCEQLLEDRADVGRLARGREQSVRKGLGRQRLDVVGEHVLAPAHERVGARERTSATPARGLAPSASRGSARVVPQSATT